MKYLSILTLLVFALQSCGDTATTNAKPQQTAVATDAAVADLNGYEITPVAGTDLRLAELKGEDGDVIISGCVDAQGRKQGSWTTWKDSRSPTLVAHYLNGQLNGGYMEMDGVGRIKKMAHYLNGQLHGRYAEYRAGIPQVTASYSNGQLHGTYRKHTLQNGKVNRSISYKNGQPDGPMRWFNDNEELIQERMYRKGELVE